MGNAGLKPGAYMGCAGKKGAASEGGRYKSRVKRKRGTMYRAPTCQVRRKRGEALFVAAGIVAVAAAIG